MRFVAVPTVASCLVVSSLVGPVEAQLPVTATPKWTIQDSLRYLHDSTAIDSLSHLIALDSLRMYYRRAATPADPASAMNALRCESYRLWIIFGRAADLAEERVRAQEWTPDHAPTIRRAIESAWTRPNVPQGACGIPADLPHAPDRLRYGPFAPWRSQYIRSGSDLETIRRGETLFEGTAVVHSNGRDTTIALAGDAALGGTEKSVGLVLQDKLHKSGTIVITLGFTPGPFLYRGSYPIFSSEDVKGVPNVAAGFMESGDMPDVFDGRWAGTLTVVKADSNWVEGDVSFWIQRHGLAVHRARLPMDSLRDTVRVAGHFRAKYNRDEERSARMYNRIPAMPREFAQPPPPDARTTLARTFLDETAPCERLPVYSTASVILPSRVESGSPVRGAIDIALDSTGAPLRWRISVLSIMGQATIGDFTQQMGLRFRRSEPDQMLTRVRCTLTLPHN